MRWYVQQLRSFVIPPKYALRRRCLCDKLPQCSWIINSGIDYHASRGRSPVGLPAVAAGHIQGDAVTSYTIGAVFERKVVEYLQEHKFFALRSPGSRSKIDVIAIRAIIPGLVGSEVLFIQCKRAGWLDPASWNELFAIARACSAIPIIASKVARQPILFEELTGLKVAGGGKQPKQVWFCDPHTSSPTPSTV